MIALHISYFDGYPFLWSESKKTGDLKELRAAAKAIGLKADILKSNTEEVVTWLPSRGKLPVPSSNLVGIEPDNRRKIQINPFFVVARRLQNEELFELTAIAEGGNVPGSSVIFGNSIAMIGQLRKIAVNLIAEEAFLPTIIQQDSRWEGRWMPFPGENYDLLLEKLVVDMPAVCRCMSKSPDVPPEIPSQIVVGGLLAHIMDNLIRNANTAAAGRRKQPASIHEAWLHALINEDAAIAWKNEQDIREFSGQLSQWRRLVDLNAQSPFKFCFRLAEPPDGGDKSGKWCVDYLLQPKADQSLHLPVSELWKKNSMISKKMCEFGGNLTEFMLTALGQASGICPYILDSLKRKNPDGFKLDANRAIIFLREYAEALRSAGFTVMLPSWWVGRNPVHRLGLKVKSASPIMQGSGNGISLNSIVNLNYTLLFNGEELSIEELKTLAELKAPLLKIRGQWTQIDQHQISSAIMFLQKQKTQTMSARELLAMALGADKKDGNLTVDSVEIDGWLNELLEKLIDRKKFRQLRQPKGFTGKLRHYQKRGFSWLSFLRQWGLGACLADDMGLGKTIQTLALIIRERESGENRPVLLICPTSVVNNWRKEAEKFTPDLDVLVYHGSDRRKKKSFEKSAPEHALVVSSYGLLHRDVNFFKKVQWAGLVLDEAQNIKNPETKQSKAARAIKSDYRIALTGTPVENHVGDLWALMDFLNPGLLGNQTSFKNNFYRPIQIFQNAGTAAKLKNLTGPFILRRMKTDKSIISDLPEKMEMKDYCTLTKEQASLYQAVADDMQKQIEQVEGINRRGLVLATLMKLKQVCNHPAQFTGDNSSIDGRSGKLDRLKNMLYEIREFGERTLIFTQFAEMGKMLQRYFQEQFGEEVLFLYGSVSRKKRDEMIERFQNDDNAPYIFILSLKAGGTGLNLTRANQVIHYDRWWNPAVENQATDRSFRIGQTKNVHVHKFIVAGTLEERIDEMIERKTGIAGQVIGTGEQWLSELSNDELREMIKLSSEAVGE
ncbi:DEAD/DEAH box helicase [candidate division KSB1 bacterium]